MATIAPLPQPGPAAAPAPHAWAEVSLAALRHNARVLCRHVGPSTALMAVVKANAYGHGMIESARAFLESGAVMLGVAHVAEALRLRQAGIAAPILILGGTGPEDARLARRHGIACTIASAEWLESCATVTSHADPPLRVHLMVDTGMGRIGVWPADCLRTARQALALPGVELEGVATHFATADEANLDLARVQLARFHGVLAELARAGVRVGWVHAANSAATIRMPATHFNLVRCGIALYGLQPAPQMRSNVPLEPALRLASRVTAVRDLPAGATVGYGASFTAPAPMRAATVAIGYADGYSRALSNRGVVTFDGRRLPVLGRVSMDQIVVDARRTPSLRPGDAVTVYSDLATDANSVEHVARQIGAIPYEVTCLLTERVQRVYAGR